MLFGFIWIKTFITRNPVCRRSSVAHAQSWTPADLQACGLASPHSLSVPCQPLPSPPSESCRELSEVFGKLSGISGKLSGRKWRHSHVPRVPCGRPLQRPGHQGRHYRSLPGLTYIVFQGIMDPFRDAILRTDTKTRKGSIIPGTLYCVLTWSPGRDL